MMKKENSNGRTDKHGKWKAIYVSKYEEKLRNKIW